MDEILEVILFYSETAGICLIFYFIASGICANVKYSGAKKKYLKLLLASLICLFFFLTYGLADNYLDLKSRVLAPMWFLLFPISVILSIIFSILFFTKKRPGHS